MLNVSQAVKDAYSNPSSGKTLIVFFPDLDITVDPNTVYSESFKLTELIMDTTSIEFVGCLPSKMQVQIQDFGENVKGERVQVFIQVDTGTTNEEPTPVFDGIVDTVTQQSNKRIKELVAYDELYTKGNTDIAQWYIYQFEHDWEDGVTLKDFRDELFNYLDIDVKPANLVNDNLQFSKQYSPVNMKALDIIKYICQINGVFGIINRDGVFEYRSLTPISSGTAIEVGIYKQIDYQEFTVKPVDKLTIRQTDSEEGVSVGSGDNIYIIQGNFFTYNLDAEVTAGLASNLYPLISTISYIPYKVTQVGYPYLECGDIVQYDVYDFEASQEQHEDVYKPIKFYIFERYLTGVQALRDEYEAEGEEEQSVFITNINAQLQTIKDQIDALQDKINSIELKYLMFYNNSDVDVADGETQVVATIEFAVQKDSQVHIEMEWLLECETTEETVDGYLTNDDLRVTVVYEYDGVVIDSREPKETYQDGKHILSAYYVLDATSVVSHIWKASLTCDGGSVHIDTLQAQNSILGLNVVGGETWDGTINVTDTVSAIVIENEITVEELSDDVVITFQNPVPITLTEQLSDVTIGTNITYASLTDDVSTELETE